MPLAGDAPRPFAARPHPPRDRGLARPPTSAPSPPTGSAPAADAPWSSATAATSSSARHDLDRVDHFFSRFGSIAVLNRTHAAHHPHLHRLSRGRGQNEPVEVPPSTPSSAPGPGAYALAYAGMKLGAAWNTDPRFKQVFHRFPPRGRSRPPRRRHLVRPLPLEEPHPHRRRIAAWKTVRRPSTARAPSPNRYLPFVT